MFRGAVFSGHGVLAKPSVNTSTGRHAFSYAAPQIWNATAYL